MRLWRVLSSPYSRPAANSNPFSSPTEPFPQHLQSLEDSEVLPIAQGEHVSAQRSPQTSVRMGGGGGGICT